MSQRFAGSTEDAAAPFVGAGFWKKGTRVEGEVFGRFDTENGESFNIRLTKPVMVNGDKTDKISVGGLKGMEMALRASGVPNGKFQVGDKVIIECTGSTDTTKGSPRLDFKVLVDRPDNKGKQASDF
jgi:hypothetical protein